jgi:hypothetical protein
MRVAADSQLVGTTPAHVRIRTGQLLVVSGGRSRALLSRYAGAHQYDHLRQPQRLVGITQEGHRMTIERTHRTDTAPEAITSALTQHFAARRFRAVVSTTGQGGMAIHASKTSPWHEFMGLRFLRRSRSSNC